jgi:hypothetical protein
VIEQQDICKHVVEFYKMLFGSAMHKGVHLATCFWPQGEILGETDKALLCSPFSEKDVETVILSMKFESAPDPNRLTVTFLGNSGNT